jgi:hypothetical protein
VEEGKRWQIARVPKYMRKQLRGRSSDNCNTYCVSQVMPSGDYHSLIDWVALYSWHILYSDTLEAWPFRVTKLRAISSNLRETLTQPTANYHSIIIKVPTKINIDGQKYDILFVILPWKYMIYSFLHYILIIEPNILDGKYNRVKYGLLFYMWNLEFGANSLSILLP